MTLFKFAIITLSLVVGLLNMPASIGQENMPWQSQLDEASRLKDQEQYAEAQAVLLEALASVEAEAPQTAAHIEVLSQLATVEDIYLEDRRSALKRYEQIVDILKHNSDPEDDSQQVGYLQMMGDLYFAMEQPVQGIQCYEVSLDIEEQVLGSQHHIFGNDQKRLASYYLKYGEDAKAEALLKRMVAIRMTYEGEKQIAVVGPHLDLARLYAKQGRLDEAKVHYQQAIDVMQMARRKYPKSVYTLLLEDSFSTAQKEFKALP